MIFQQEYKILKALDTDKILEISFIHNYHKIKVYFSKKDDNSFFILVCEGLEHTFVKNYAIYFINNQAHINGYWADYYKYAKGLKKHNENNFDSFYNKLKRSILEINDPENKDVKYLSSKIGLQIINSTIRDSTHPNEPIFFNHIRRGKISNAQYKKVEKYLGGDIAAYLRKNGLTAVFTSDISKQKTFVLV